MRNQNIMDKKMEKIQIIKIKKIKNQGSKYLKVKKLNFVKTNNPK